MRVRTAIVAGAVAVSCANVHAQTPPADTVVRDMLWGSEIACCREPHPLLPLLAVGDSDWDKYQELPASIGRSRGIPLRGPMPSSPWTPEVLLDAATFPETTLVAHLLEAYAEKREGPVPAPARVLDTPTYHALGGPTKWVLLAAPYLPANQTWIPDQCVLEGSKVRLHVTAWETAATNTQSKQRITYVGFLGGLPSMPVEMPEGAYSILLTVDHLRQGADGYFHATGLTQSADLPFEIKAGAGTLFPRTPVPGKTPQAVDPKQLSAIFEKDLQSQQQDPAPGPAYVRPIGWSGDVRAEARGTDWTLTVGRLAQPAASLLGAQKTLTAKPELVPLKPGESAVAEDLYALITSDTWDRPLYPRIIELSSITIENGTCSFNLDLWPTPGVARTGGNLTNINYRLIPLRFLNAGDHTLAVHFNWRDAKPHVGNEEVVGGAAPTARVLVK